MNKSRTRTPSPRRSPAVPWAVAAVAALVALTAFLAPRLLEGDSETPETAPAATVDEVDPGDGDTASFARRTPDDPTALGDTDAPVVMVAYSDFQCPYCGKFARDTERRLIEKYVDRGVLRIEWRDFPYLGDESVRAALAGRAAAEQDRFWEYHDALYAEQSPPNSGRLTEAYLTDVARQAGLDVEQFTEDLDSRTSVERVQRDYDEALSAGLTGTPSFLINGTPVIGALPLAEFEAAIERAERAVTR